MLRKKFRINSQQNLATTFNKEICPFKDSFSCTSLDSSSWIAIMIKHSAPLGTLARDSFSLRRSKSDFTSFNCSANCPSIRTSHHKSEEEKTLSRAKIASLVFSLEAKSISSKRLKSSILALNSSSRGPIPAQTSYALAFRMQLTWIFFNLNRLGMSLQSVGMHA